VAAASPASAPAPAAAAEQATDDAARFEEIRELDAEGIDKTALAEMLRDETVQALRFLEPVAVDPEMAARHALRANSNDVSAAFCWLFEHTGDADIGERVYAVAAAATAAALTEMTGTMPLPSLEELQLLEEGELDQAAALMGAPEYQREARALFHQSRLQQLFHGGKEAAAAPFTADPFTADPLSAAGSSASHAFLGSAGAGGTAQETQEGWSLDELVTAMQEEVEEGRETQQTPGPESWTSADDAAWWSCMKELMVAPPSAQAIPAAAPALALASAPAAAA